MKEKGLTTSGWKIFSIVNGLIEEPIKKKNENSTEVRIISHNFLILEKRIKILFRVIKYGFNHRLFIFFLSCDGFETSEIDK